MNNKFKESMKGKEGLIRRIQISTWFRSKYGSVQEAEERLSSFLYKKSAPHEYVEIKCPVCKTFIWIVDFYTEKGEDTYNITLADREQLDLPKIEELRKEIYGKVLQKGIVPIMCPNEHKLYWDMKEGTLVGRTDGKYDEYDKYLKLLHEKYRQVFVVSKEEQK